MIVARGANVPRCMERSVRGKLAGWRSAFGHALVTGSCASILSAATLALCGLRENGRPAGPLNGPSQWVWGTRGALKRAPSLANTAIGYAIHHATSIGWALMQEKFLPASRRPVSLPQAVARSALTSAAACFVDYRIAPRRLQPGFDKQLSRTALLLVYAAFAGGLAVGSRRIPTTARRALRKKLSRTHGMLGRA